jgi:ATP-dependent DNA helicase RecQ
VASAVPAVSNSSSSATEPSESVAGAGFADDGIPTIVIHRDDDDATTPLELGSRALVTTAPSAPQVMVSDGTPGAPPSEALLRALQKMRDVFRIRELRPGQAEIIESVLAGRDTLAIMPTGSGKSLTYQLPALVMEGPTLVVSPLLALIEDQVLKLKSLGIPVARIDSTRTAKERAADLEAVRAGTIKLVLITPESVGSPTVQEALAGVKFSLFCVDEAHCVSQWGHDFRPSYLGLRRAAQVLGRPPILGLTATATPAIGDDVLVQLGMKDPKVCRVSFHRPNLAFDVRKVAGEADKLRQLGKLIQRLRRPGIVYCSTVRAVDDLYIALRHGKIPVERYNGKMSTDEREAAQASFMQTGRKVVMLATNAFGLGIDKPDIRYIIHYQMPGSPEAYVQEAGRAGRDGKPARCVLLFQPDDIDIQEHFLKEAHPTKSQARMVADGLYAWSDEGKEVSVRDLALSMALPERRVRVILSVLEAMGVAKEVRAARWEGVEPRPSREQIDKAASVFEARRISDRRRLASLLAYMNTQRCRVQMLRAYFGEGEGEKCGLCDSCAGLDSEVFDPGSADERHGLHAATDFHARPRRRRRGRVGEVRIEARDGREIREGREGREVREGREARVGRDTRLDGPAPLARPIAPLAPVFETSIPTNVLPPLAPFQVAPPHESESTFDEGIWNELTDAGTALAGEPVIDPDDIWFRVEAVPEGTQEIEADAAGDPATATDREAETKEDATKENATEDGAPQIVSAPDADGAVPVAVNGSTFEGDWLAVRDANIRPYVEWRAAPPVTLPVIAGSSASVPRPQNAFQPAGGHPSNNRPHGGGSGGGGSGGGPNAGGRRRRRRRPGGGGPNGNGNGGGGSGGGGGGGGRQRNFGRDGGDRNRDRERGPRLPGFYNPGGD